MKLCIVTNIPAPYRVPIYNILNEKMGDDFLAIYCSPRQDNRSWDLPEFEHQHIYLSKKTKLKNSKNKYIHSNINILYHLWKFKPDIIITTGFNPTHLFSWLYTILFNKKHIPMTDGWLYSESFLSWKHRLIRKIVFRTSNAFIAAGKNGFKLYESYGIHSDKIFQSHLCIDNDKFLEKYIPTKNRKYDLIFSGRFNHTKQPLFFLRVIREISKHRCVRALMLGEGPLSKKVTKFIEENNLHVECPGFLSQNQLPDYYTNSKLFLFPTLNDPWGVVVNEALVSGTPVIISPYSGTVNDLVIDGYNGFILPLSEKKWIDKTSYLLEHIYIIDKLSKNSLAKVQKFNYVDAAQGILNASFFAIKKYKI